MLHATNWACLHKRIGILNVGGVLATDEAAGEVGVVSEDFWVVTSPLEVYLEKDHLLLVDVGKLGRLLLYDWLSIVINEHVIGVKLAVGVHDAHRKRIEANIFATVIQITLWICLNFYLVLIQYFVHLGGWLATHSKLLIVRIMLECNLLLAIITGVRHSVSFDK